MGARQKDWARRASINLRKELGSRCVECGRVRNLQFDCIQPRGHEHHSMEWSQRVSFYRSERAAGNLQLLCERCHVAKSCLENRSVSDLAVKLYRLSRWYRGRLQIGGVA